MKVLISILFSIFSFFANAQEGNSVFKGEICYQYQTSYIATGDKPIPPALFPLTEPRIKCFVFSGNDTITTYILSEYDTLNISKHAEGYHETFFNRKGHKIDFSALSKKSRTKSKIKTIVRDIIYKGYKAEKVEISRTIGNKSYSIIATDLNLNINYDESKAAGLFITKRGLILKDSTYSQITKDVAMEKETELLSIKSSNDLPNLGFPEETIAQKYVSLESTEKNKTPIPLDLREKFDFEGTDMNKDSVSSDIFKGSFAYVALWASWCEPCLRSIAFLSDLNSNYEFNDINIVSLSVDEEKDFDKWIEKSDSEHISWPNYILKNGMKSSACTQLGVSAIPYYFIIDQNGKVMLENAPSPSDPNLKEVFRSILKSK